MRLERPSVVQVVGGGFLAAFGDLRQSIEDTLARGDCVVTRSIIHAVHRDAFQGSPATGRQVSMAVVSMTRVRDARVVEDWTMPDQFGLLQQLGAIPAPGY